MRSDVFPLTLTRVFWVSHFVSFRSVGVTGLVLSYFSNGNDNKDSSEYMRVILLLLDIYKGMYKNSTVDFKK